MIAMMCEHCEGRWVALTNGATIGGGKVSYHFDAEALECPRCGKQGIADAEVLDRHQRHPNVVASTELGPIRDERRQSA